MAIVWIEQIEGGKVVEGGKVFIESNYQAIVVKVKNEGGCQSDDEFWIQKTFKR